MALGGPPAMARALILQNSPLEGPGLLAGLLEDDGYLVDTVDARRGGLDRSGFGLLVVLGGPEGANDDLPHLREEESLMRECAARGTPVLGICLGAQLLARSLGAEVRRARRPEVGFGEDVVPDVDGGVMAGLASPFAAFHMHNDAFGLPRGAVRLAHSESCENQAFCAGRAVGLQFHLEAGLAMALSWLRAAARAGELTAAQASEQAARAARMAERVNANMRTLYRNLSSEMWP